MIYDIRKDVTDPDSGEIVAEEGDLVRDPDRQELIDLIIEQSEAEGWRAYEITEEEENYRVIS